MKKLLALLALLPSLALAQYYGPPYNPSNTQINGQPAGTMANQNANAVAITGGSISGTSVAATSVTSTGNIAVQGSLSSTTNTQPASITNSGVALVASPSVATEQFFQSGYSADNRTAELIFFQNCLQSRFKNDSQAGAIAPLSLCGGYASGITGITSNSGSGIWAHTGAFSATGDISSSGNIYATVSGGNNVVLTGSANAGTPTISTSGANNNVSLNISTKGGGGINLNSSTAVTGNLSATGNISATGTGTMPVYGNTGTAFTNQHMVTGYVTLASGAATVTLSGSAVFTNATTYTCTASDTTAAAAVKVVPASGTSITFSGTTTDVIAYQCVGN